MVFAHTLFFSTFKQALRAALLAGAVLLALVWLLQSLRFLDFLVNKGLGLGVFLQLTGLLVPRLLVVILPIAILAGAIMVARRAQDDHETTAILAAGGSPWQLAKPLLALGAVGVVMLYILMLNILPSSVTAFKDLQAELRTRQGQLLLEEGTFNPLGDNLMVYVQRRLTPHRFAQLLVHDTRDPNTPVTWYARFGEVLVQPNGAPQLKLEQGLRQEVGPRGMNALEFASYTLDLSPQLGIEAMGVRAPEVEERSLRATLALAQNPQTQAGQAAELYAEIANRLTWPLLPLSLVALAAGALLHPPKRKQSSLRGVVLAAVLGVVCIGGQFGGLVIVQGGALWGLYLMALWPFLFLAVAYGVWQYGQR